MVIGLNNQIFRKIFISFLAVISIYTTVILFSVIKNEFQRQENIRNTATEFLLERETNSADIEFIAAVNSMRILANKESVIHISDNSRKMTYLDYAPIYDELVGDHFSNYSQQYNIAVTTDFGEPIISSDGYFNFHDYLDFIQLGQNLQDIKNFFASTDISEITLIDGQSKMTLIRKMNVAFSNSSVYFFITWEKKDLFSSITQENDHDFFVVDTVFHYDAPWKSDRSAEFISTIEEEEPTDYAIRKIQDDKKIAYQKKSTVLPTLSYIYVTDVPKKEIPTSIIIIILRYLLVLIVVGLLIGFIFSKKNYQPYKKIVKELAGGKFKNKNADKVDDVLEDIHHLMESNKNLSTFQMQTADEVKELYFKNILIGRYSSEEIKTLLSILELEEFNQGGFVVIFTFQGISKAEATLETEERILARKSIISLISEKINPSKMIILTLSAERFALIFANTNQTNVIKIINKIADEVYRKIGVTSNFILSLPFDNIFHFPEVFREVNRNFDDPYLFELSKLEVANSDSFRYPIEIEHKLLQNAKLGHYDEVETTFEAFIRKNLLESQVSLTVVQEIKVAMLQTIKRMVQHRQMPFEEYLSQNRQVINDLKIATDPETVYHLLLTLLKKVIVELTQNEGTQVCLEEKLLAYINQNFYRDVSLSDVAEAFHLSDSYVSRVIKEYLGISFKTYLNRVRVDEGKRLLATNQYRVQEVAEAVGCRNVNTFIRIFKQFEGKTPGKFIHDTSQNQ